MIVFKTVGLDIIHAGEQTNQFNASCGTHCTCGTALHECIWLAHCHRYCTYWGAAAHFKRTLEGID
jgi:hypothetical protein